MSKSILIALVLALTVTGCDCGKKKQQTQPAVTTDTPCGNYMTNEQIIEETRKCEDAGLDAQALHCGNEDHKTTSIQCEPRAKGAE